MKLNLEIPTSWGDCSVKQLEDICFAQQQVVGADEQLWTWKISCFLRLANLDLIEGPIEDEQEGAYILVVPSALPDSTPVKMLVSLLYSIIHDYLQWLGEAPNIVRFPYPEWKHDGVVFHGPSLYLSGWTWQQYRLLKDYLDYFFHIEQLARTSPNVYADQLNQAMASVLATIYDAPVNYLDEHTHLPTYGHHYHPHQSKQNKKHFLSFPPIRFAVIVLWWASVVYKIKKDYPKCFGSGKPEKKKKKEQQPDPFKEYARFTATLEKYMDVNEQELQQESYIVVLQHLQDMIEHNEYVEKMNARINRG